MGGRGPDRNPVSPEKTTLLDWNTGDETTTPRNIRWKAKVGSYATGGPIVANGLVWVGTNNDALLEAPGSYGVLRDGFGRMTRINRPLRST